MVNQCSLTVWIALVVKKEKQKYNKQTNKQRKTKEINKQIKNGNKNLRNGWKGDLEFSAR